MAGSLNMNVYSLNVEDDNNDNDLVGTSESDKLDGKNGDDVLIDDLAKLGVDTAQSNVQNIKCEIKGFLGSIDDSCFNYNSQNPGKGDSLASQNGGYGKVELGIGLKDDNSAEPAINNAQGNVQNVQCVSGGSIDDSCFNYNSQNLGNEGNIALAQDGGKGDDGSGDGGGQGEGDGNDGSGDGGGGNSAEPAINNAQGNVQNVQCVSGEDAIVSCHNVSFQNQINEGNIALGQTY